MQNLTSNLMCAFLIVFMTSCADDVIAPAAAPQPVSQASPAPKPKAAKPTLVGLHYVEVVEFFVEESGATIGPGDVDVSLRWCVEPDQSPNFSTFELSERPFGLKPRVMLTSESRRLSNQAGWKVFDGEAFFPKAQDLDWPAEVPESVYQIALDSGFLCAILEARDSAFQEEWLVNQGVLFRVSPFLKNELATYGEIVLPPVNFSGGQNAQNITRGHIQIKLVR